MTHAVVLALAGAMSGYATVDRNYFPNSHAAAVTAAASDGGVAGDVSLGRDSVIIKAIPIPTAPLVSRVPIVHIVAPGDTLESIGRQFNLPWRYILWSNPGLRLPLTIGRPLEVAPVQGVVVTVKRGDTPASLASAYGVDVTTLLGFNGIRGPQLTPGSTLVIPIDPTQGPNLSTGVPADPVDPGQFLCPIAGAQIIQGFGPTSFAIEPSFADYFGIRVEVTDSFGLVEIYAHMSQVAVALGQQVQQGATVGYVGSTGLSVGAHLHFQLEVGGMPIDPGPLAGCSGYTRQALAGNGSAT
jgi:LysM repeat protein